MSKSLIQTVNQTTQNVVLNGDISFGSVVRRYGCNCRLSGNGIELAGDGYYPMEAAVTVEPTAAGEVTVVLYCNGIQIPGAIASGYAAAANTPVTLPLIATIRNKCCDSLSTITCELIAGPGVVTNVSFRAEKS